jgi:outer membrane protein
MLRATEILSLQEAVDLARNNNPAAKAHMAATQTAKASVISARSSYLPQVEAFGGVSRYMKKPGIVVPAGELGNPNSINLQTSDQTVPTAGVDLKQTIYDFGRTSSSMKAVVADQKISAETEGLFLQDLAVMVTRSYLDVLMSREVQRVAINSLDAYKSHLITAEQLFAAGSVSRNDLLAAEIAKSKSELELTSANNRQEMAEISFEKIVGVRPERMDDSVMSSAGLSNVNEGSTGDIERAKQQRKEIAINEAQQRAILAREKNATSQYLPKLFGEAKATYMDDKYQLNKDQYYFGVGVSLPVFDGLRAYGDRKKAMAEHEAAKMNQKHIEDQIELDVTQARLDLKAARENISVAAVNERRATENLRTVRERYKAGDVPASEVLDAIALWKDARLSVIEAQCATVLSNTLLSRARGDNYVGEDKN